ncbi:MAG: tetratricopeptide repeat protein, partial [Pseudomonadota bacterium]
LYQQAVQADSPDSEIAMTISGMLGARYFDAGRLAEAHDITERALAIAIDIYGDGSQRVQLWRSNLAEFKVYLKLGEPALQYAAQTYQTNADLLGKDHLYTLFMADVYGLAQVRWGDVQSGLTLLQETVQMKRDKFGPEHAFVRDTEIYLVEALFLSADMDGARDLALRLQTAIAANKSIHRVKSDLLESLLEKIN